MKRIDVCIAVIESEGRVLLAKRSKDQHQGGLWEFPGGKVDLGETLEEALVREVREEVGLRVVRFEALTTITHDYEDRLIQLHVFRVSEFDGQAKACEGQLIKWLELSALSSVEFPKANQAIVDLLLSN